MLWVLGVLGAGNANGALGWLLILAMPLSALGAWFAADALTQRRRLRLAAALVWAGSRPFRWHSTRAASEPCSSM